METKVSAAEARMDFLKNPGGSKTESASQRAPSADISFAQKTVESARTKALETQSPPGAQIRGFVESMVNEAEPKLNLTASDLDILTAVVMDTMRINGAIKSECAKLQTDNKGEILVTIPSRPEVADQVWKFFQEQLATRLSPGMANLIDDSLGERMMQWMWGYGAANETYRLSPSRQTPGNYDYSFSAEIPRNIPRSAVSVIGDRYGGGSDSGTNTPLAKIISYPPYEFLTRIIPSSGGRKN